jgi:hypothetical protein
MYRNQPIGTYTVYKRLYLLRMAVAGGQLWLWQVVRQMAVAGGQAGGQQYFRTESLFNENFCETVSPIGLAFPARH